MAAMVFEEQLRRAGLENRVEVSSAGIGSWHIGDRADPRAASVLVKYGYSCDHKAAQVSRRHLQADLLLAMDRSHERDLRRLAARAGSDPDRIMMLRSFDPKAAAAGDLEIPDPYYGGAYGFTDVLRMVEASMPGLLAWVRSELGS
jgi:protein-tyrosine phosphatase